MKPFYSRDHD